MRWGAVERFERNLQGRDFVVGDIHGNFTGLKNSMTSFDFDPERDRLFSVGDLVDRGEESLQALDWLEKPWFHAVRGNHERMAIAVQSGDLSVRTLVANGGRWFIDLDAETRQRIADRFQQLPLAIEIETPQGLMGVVHADCPGVSWQDFTARIKEAAASPDDELMLDLETNAMWSRDRFDQGVTTPVDGVSLVIVGHTPTSAPLCLGNVMHIETMGWRPERDGYFTLIELPTEASLKSDSAD